MKLMTSLLLMLLLGNYCAWSQSPDDEDYRNSEESRHALDLPAQSNCENASYVAAGKYTLYTKAASWLEAMLICWAKGAVLAVPFSRDDAIALGRLLAIASANITGTDMRDAVHVGLTDSKDEGDWHSVSGSSVTATGYNNWLGGRLEPNKSANCAALLADGHYIQVSCDAVRAYACEPRPTPVKRSDGYVDIADIGTYKLHTEPLTWGEAGRRCAEEGATLAVPTSQRAAGVLAGAFVATAADAKIKEEGIFVGINDLASEGVWRTILDERLEHTGFATWTPGEPSGGEGENCGALLGDGRYADHPCSKPMAFCCEIGGPRQKNVEALAIHGRYFLFAEEIPWLSAVQACHRQNATLAAPRDNNEFDILHILASLPTNRNYDGLHMGAFYRGDGIPVTSIYGEDIFYTHLDQSRDGRCLLYTSYSYELTITDCNDRRAYICKSD